MQVAVVLGRMAVLENLPPMSAPDRKFIVHGAHRSVGVSTPLVSPARAADDWRTLRLCVICDLRCKGAEDALVVLEHDLAARHIDCVRAFCDSVEQIPWIEEIEDADGVIVLGWTAPANEAPDYYTLYRETSHRTADWP